MRIRSKLLPAVATLVLLAACGGTAPAGTPSRTDGGTTGPAAAWLRLSTTQAIPPELAFAVADTAVITGDGDYVTPGPVPAIYPGPALPNLVGRPISDAGRAAILDEARRLGLLAGRTDFMPDERVVGGVTGRMLLTPDGTAVTLIGDPSAVIQCVTTPCDAPPDTPAAFAELWMKLQDPAAWLGEALGPEAPFIPDAYALLLGPAPAPEPGLGSPPADWPLPGAVATFGRPVLGGYRCGIVRGEEAALLRPALEGATQLTQWVEDPARSATFGVSVRPVIADEDPCAETFGAG